MRCPPYAVSVRVKEAESTKFRLWFPFFILWPLLLVIVLLVLVGTLLADLVTRLSGHKPGYTRLVFGVVGIMGEARGTEVFFQDRSHQNRTVAVTVR